MGKAKQLHLQYSLRSDIRFIVARICKADAKQESAFQNDFHSFFQISPEL